MHAHSLLIATGLTLLASGPVAAASSDPWRVLPVVGGDGDRARVEDVAVSPLDPDHLFAWTYGLLYRSTDGGAEWTLVPARFSGQGPSPPLRKLRLDRADADGAWGVIGRRIYRTTDTGRNWLPWGTSPPGEVLEDFEIDATDPATAWAATSGGLDRGAWLTTDAGSTWEPRREGLLLADVRTVAARPGDPGTLVAGTGDGLARSTDAGASWTWVHVGANARHVEWSASGALVRAYQAGLVESTDAGATWRLIPSEIRNADKSYAFDAGDPAQLLLANVDLCGGYYQYGHFGTTRRSTDGGASWTRKDLTNCLYTGYFGSNVPGAVEMSGAAAWSWLPPTPASSVALHRTTDGGETWESATAGMKELPIATFDVDGTGAAFARENYWLGAGAALRCSTDGGATWPVVDTWSYWGFQQSRFLEASRTRPGDLLEGGGGYDYDYGWDYIARSTNGGVDWVVCEYATWEMPYLAAFNHGSGDTLYVWSSNQYWWDETPPEEASLFRSDDGGLAYGPLGDSPFVPVAALVTPETDAEVFAATRDAEPVMRTTDAGLTWHPRSDGLPAGIPAGLLMDPANGDHLVVAFERGVPWESTDRGASWAPLARGIDPARATPEESPAPPDLDLRGVAVLDADWDLHAGQRRVFLSTDHGIWASDLGFIGTGRPQIAFDRVRYSRSAGVLYAVSSRHGVFGLDLEPIGPLPGSATSAAAVVGFAPLSLAPNPFTESASIRFGLGRAGSARLEVFDPAGRRVATLVDGRLAAGLHAATWSGRNAAGRIVAPGVYFVRLTTGEQRITRRVVRLR